MASSQLLSEFNFLMNLVNLVSLIGTDLELLSFRVPSEGSFPQGRT